MTAQFPPKVEALRKNYIAAVEKMQAKTQAEGDLEGTLALKKEMEALSQGKEIKPLEKGENVITQIKQQRKAYFDQMKKLRGDASVIEKRMMGQFVNMLLGLETKFTKSNQLEKGIIAHNLASTIAAYQKRPPDEWYQSSKPRVFKGLEEIRNLFPLNYVEMKDGKKSAFAQMNQVLRKETEDALILINVTKVSDINLPGLFGNDAGFRTKFPKMQLGGFNVNTKVLMFFNKGSNLRLIRNGEQAVVVGRIANCHLSESEEGRLNIDIVNAVSASKGGVPDSSTIPFPPELTIVSAKFGNGNTWVDVRNVIERTLLQERRPVWISPPNMGNDPKPGWVKQLSIHYILGGESKRLTNWENTHISWTDLYTIKPKSIPEKKLSPNNIELTIRQSKINSLLVIDSGSGKGYAGLISGLTATAFKEEGDKPAEVKFNQEVGKMMSTAMAEVVKYTHFVNNGWPKGYRIEFGFDEKYSGKDGPSAAVACGLLLDSMITGHKIDSRFAVTGDMNVDGSVQPIGGVRAKIRGATKGNCTVVAVPKKNERAVSDLFVLDGPEPFAKIQIFSISDFRDAKAIARTNKVGPEKNAIETFTKVQSVLLKDPNRLRSMLQNRHVIAKLKAVLDEKPNHLSTKYLYLYATGKAPKSLSVSGSFQAIENGGNLLIDSIQGSNAQNSVSSLKPDAMGKSISHLKNLRRVLDPRLRHYNDSIVDFGLLVQDIQRVPINSQKKVNVYMNRLNQSINNVKTQRAHLLKDPEIIEAFKY